MSHWLAVSGHLFYSVDGCSVLINIVITDREKEPSTNESWVSRQCTLLRHGYSAACNTIHTDTV